jgi:hypothetical protein
LYHYRTLCRATVIGVALLVYVAADHPTGSWTIKVLLVAVVVLALLEILARPPRAGEGAQGVDAGPPPPAAPA